MLRSSKCTDFEMNGRRYRKTSWKGTGGSSGIVLIIIIFGSREKKGRDSSVGIATGYGLEDPGIEYQKKKKNYR
jgi:hypothetical protein